MLVASLERSEERVGNSIAFHTVSHCPLSAVRQRTHASDQALMRRVDAKVIEAAPRDRKIRRWAPFPWRADMFRWPLAIGLGLHA